MNKLPKALTEKMYIPSLGGVKSFLELIEGGMITQAQKDLATAKAYRRVRRDILNPEIVGIQTIRIKRKPAYKLITLNNSSLNVPKQVYDYYIRKKQLV
jgi:hypothetical protein